MDFSWTPEQSDLYDRALAFARERLEPASKNKEPDAFRTSFRVAGEFGLLGLCVPEEYGGIGLGALDTARTFEAAGKGCTDSGLLFGCAAHLFACAMPILEFAQEDLKRALLPKLCKGELVGANAITEDVSGSDAFAMRTSVEIDGDNYYVTGAKSYVTNGPFADVFVTYGTKNPAYGHMGIVGVVLERDTPGLTVGAPFEKIGLKGAPISSVYYERCKVPATARLGREGQGSSVFTRSMHWERACLFGIYLGVMERQIELVVGYLKNRRQFGKPLAKQQALAHKVADMKLRLEAARLLLYRACWKIDRGEDATQEIAMSKIATSEAAIQSSLDAIQLYGGNGVMEEMGIAVMLRDAVPSTIFSGTSEIQRNLIARGLGL
jgi:alkylation response protein AidB-like acyl-CoA dehydrogenase